MKKLMEILTENAELFVDCLALSIRECKYGKGERALFETDEEMLAIINYLYNDTEGYDRDIFNAMRRLKGADLNALKSLRMDVLKAVMKGVDLLANLDKAIETVNIREAWKEIEDGRKKGTGQSEAEDNEDEHRPAKPNKVEGRGGQDYVGA